VPDKVVVLVTTKVATLVPATATTAVPVTFPCRPRVPADCPWPHVAVPEKALPTVRGHGGEATGAPNTHVVPASGTFSESRKTPLLLNRTVVVALGLTHCCVPPPAEVTTRVLCDGTEIGVEVVPLVTVDVPVVL
jgi:hypothetical protein